MLLVGQQFFSVFKKKARISGFTTSSQKVPNGSSTNADGVDFEWIPKEHLQTSNSLTLLAMIKDYLFFIYFSIKIDKSPKISPRQRRSNGKTATASSEE